METSQDHKPVDDGDTGPMTGGMGAYSPTPVVTDDDAPHDRARHPRAGVDGLVREGIEYKRRALRRADAHARNGPKVLEFNCRFGDPETQPLMMRLKSDLLEVMLAVADGRLDQVDARSGTRGRRSCVVAASRGYPGKYKTGVPITGIDKADAMPRREGLPRRHEGATASRSSPTAAACWA